MRIGILLADEFDDPTQAAIGPYQGLFERLLSGHGFTYHAWKVSEMELPDSPDDAEGWLVTGSKAGTYEDHPWITPLEETIRNIRASSRPLVGICFGHQIIAQALGGRVEKYAGGWCVGRHVYQIDGRDVPLNAWHQDQVVELPPDGRRLGQSSFCENAVLAYGETVLTYQPHPEFDADVTGHFARTLRGGAVPDEILDAAQSKLHQPTDGDQIGQQIAAHFLLNRR
ncbi:type 1 glutamine amidotransferase [Nioella aestuarii]|uniref:type 1 glutamine amidotransferase n=1 Tax=Nioella aestuarii TaxID=1662864 RepID=UPI003D7F7290